MNTPLPMQQDLEAHAALCGELLALATTENQSLRDLSGFKPSGHDALRKSLLPRLDESLDRLRSHRMSWQRLSSTERARHPEIARLIQTTQELAMKIIVLDRENEQALLRRGLVPARHLPSPQREQPGYVAGLYQRHTS